MSGAAFILFINLAIACLFCCAFSLLAAYDRSNVAARWFAAAYGFGVVNLGFEAAIPLLADARIGLFLAYIAFQAALLSLCAGLIERYKVEPPRKLLAFTLGATLLIGALVQDMPRDTLLRLTLYQLPYIVMQAIGAWIILKADGRRLGDNLLATVLVLCTLHYISKPFLALALGGPGGSPQQYLASDYAMVSHTMGSMLAIATALLLLALLVMDILKGVIVTSETDLLSGLLNRRGFEARLEELVRVQRSAPLSLVICDLDHFKLVNDTWGHASGDRLIALFARTLTDHAGKGHAIGRIGGEEFAAILPGSDLAAGRLYAEGARSAFASNSADIVSSEGTSFTASFGVAQLKPGEPAAALFARADAALYEAKRAGRDRVRVSPPEAVGEAGLSAVS